MLWTPTGIYSRIGTESALIGMKKSIVDLKEEIKVSDYWKISKIMENIVYNINPDTKEMFYKDFPKMRALEAQWEYGILPEKDIRIYTTTYLNWWERRAPDSVPEVAAQIPEKMVETLNEARYIVTDKVDDMGETAKNLVTKKPCETWDIGCHVGRMSYKVLGLFLLFILFLIAIGYAGLGGVIEHEHKRVR